MVKPCGVVAYLTDVGLMDPYAGSIKGMTLRFCVDAKIVDITHDIQSFDVAGASFILLLTYRYFPHGTVFVVVVVPGVGASERPILIVSKNYYFVGPDNGVLLSAAEDDGIEHVLSLSNVPHFNDKVTKTFHGRDIFAPAAAMLICGMPPESLGKPIPVSDLVRLGLKSGCPESWSGTEPVKLSVMHVDRYGNVILAGNFNQIIEALGITVGHKVIVHSKGISTEAITAESFANTGKGALILYENSYGLAELAVNQGSAKNVLGVRRGDPVAIARSR